MEPIDNLFYLAVNQLVSSDYKSEPWSGITLQALNGRIFYDKEQSFKFVTVRDYSLIDKTIKFHWFDIGDKRSYVDNFEDEEKYVCDFTKGSPYHLMYAYLIENTRIAQIFSRVLEMFFTDEQLGNANDNGAAFQWMVNTERLFFKGENYNNLRSLIRPNPEAIRRNAYSRLFSLDLAFGDGSSNASEYPFVRAKITNKEFIIIFEQYLTEIWQAYINAKNSSGPNATDTYVISDLATKLRQLLQSRRGTNPNYFSQHLSYEEYSSVIMLAWFAYVLSFNNDVTRFLNCESTTFAERLFKLGERVGIPAHRKSQALFDLAEPAALILRSIESGFSDTAAASGFPLEEENWVSGMLGRSGVTPSIVQSNFMTSFLQIINNWEKATGHKIKNRESNITGTVRVAQIARGVLAAN